MGETQADGTKMANVAGRLIFKGMREGEMIRPGMYEHLLDKPVFVHQHLLATCGVSQCFCMCVCVLDSEWLLFHH